MCFYKILLVYCLLVVFCVDKAVKIWVNAQ